MIAKASGVKLPGSDPSENMEAAGTVIRFFNTALFVWIGRLLAGICVIGAAWNIKEMRILPAALCVVAAAIIGTAPAWVKGAFSMMDTGDIFDRTEAPSLIHHYYAQDQNNGSTEPHSRTSGLILKKVPSFTTRIGHGESACPVSLTRKDVHMSLTESAQPKPGIALTSGGQGLTRLATFTGPKQKGLDKMEFGVLPEQKEIYAKMPRYICYKAALLKEKMTLQIVLGIVIGISTALFIYSRIEVSRLYSQLREKEFILAPGVTDFTAVTPRAISPTYVEQATLHFLQTLGNLNPQNIDEQYATLTEFMSPQLKIQFEMESQPWKAKVKEEGISQIQYIVDKEIRDAGSGIYQVTAIVKRDTYARFEHIGTLDVAVEMELSLTYPTDGKRWFLQISKLEAHEANAFRVKTGFQNPAEQPSQPKTPSERGDK
ncbi:unnamed protein product [Sphagnum tenellum]